MTGKKEKSVYEGILQGLKEAIEFFEGGSDSKVKITKRKKLGKNTPNYRNPENKK